MLNDRETGLVLSYSRFLFPIGLYLAVKFIFFVVKSSRYVWYTHIRIMLNKKINAADKYGMWAVVTGSTSGIGEQFANELASQGVNVVLVSRSLEKLNKQAEQIKKDYGVKTKVIACNFVHRDYYKLAQDELREIDIGLLVNNVGLNTDTGSRLFDEMTLQEVRDMIVVNAGAFSLMSKVVLPGMMNRGKGYILNIGSTSGYDVLPSQALYCASKCYMRLLSLSVADEAEGSGVSVRCNVPQFVKTSMCKGNTLAYNLPFWTCDPRFYASSSLQTLDTLDTGGWWFYDLVLGFRDYVKFNVFTPDVVPHLEYFTVAKFFKHFGQEKIC